MTNHPLYNLTYHTADGRKQQSRLTLCDTLPDNTPNNTMIGETIGNAVSYDRVERAGHITLPDGCTVDADNDVVVITQGVQQWQYGIYDLIREGIATISGGGSRPVVVRVKVR